MAVMETKQGYKHQNSEDQTNHCSWALGQYFGTFTFPTEFKAPPTTQ